MKHKCEETMRWVVLYLDGELSNADEQRLLKILTECSSCFEKYNIEKEFKTFLTKKFEKKGCADSLKKEIKDQIHRLSGNA